MNQIKENVQLRLEEEKRQCFHCGDPCPVHPLRSEDKVFCCEGCKTVYEILSENNLCTYYDLEKNPGIKLKTKEFGERFAFLDNPEIARRLVSFQSEQLIKITLSLPAIHCSSCIWLLENLYHLHLGVLNSRVNFVRKELTVAFDPQKLSLRHLVEMLLSVGYEPQINLEDAKGKKQKQIDRALIYKIGVTGFCFGNIMLLSFPDYLAIQDWVDLQNRNFFAALNILLSLPIFFYSSSGYFNAAFQALRARTINLEVPIALGIVALFGRSLYEILTQTGVGYLDSLAGLLFFLLTGKWFQSKTYEGFSFERDYSAYFPLAVSVKGKNPTDSQTKIVTSLKKNEIILIHNRELIPADSILLSEEALIDYSFVTGEASPVPKKKGEYIYAGGRQCGSIIELAVQKEVSQSYLTQLWNSDIFQKDKNVRFNRKIAIFSTYFTYITLLIAFSALLFWYVVNPIVMWNAFTAVLIVACPCALSLSKPFALGNTLRIFGRNKFYLKNSEVVDHLSDINYLVFDKTGTITQNEEAVVNYEGQALNQEEKAALKSLAMHSIHPLSKKIVALLNEQKCLDAQQLIECEGKGIRAQIGEQTYSLGSREWVLENKDKPVRLQVVDQFSDENASRVYVGKNGELLGYFIIQNSYRNGLNALLASLKPQYPTAVVSGDNDSEKTTLEHIFGKDSQLHFRQKPEQKLRFIASLQEKQHKVLMLGDGLNDAGALKQSDVGIALTEDTTSFTPACDAILDASAFQKLGVFLRFAKTTNTIVKISFLISLIYNFIGLAYAVSGNLTPVFAAILMPLSSITIVTFVVFSTNTLARRAGIWVNN